MLCYGQCQFFFQYIYIYIKINNNLIWLVSRLTSLKQWVSDATIITWRRSLVPEIRIDAWNLKLKCHQILCSAMHKQESTCMVKGDELDSLLLFRCLVVGRKAVWVFNSNFFLIISNNNVSSMLRKKKKNLGVSLYFDDSGHGKKPGLLFTYRIQGGHGTSRLEELYSWFFFLSLRPLTPSLSSQFCS